VKDIGRALTIIDYYNNDFSDYSSSPLQRLEGCSNLKYEQAIAEILSFINSQHSQWLNGAQNLQQTIHVLPTECEGLDSLLGGGLLEGTLTKLVGTSASGKTQTCLRATSNIAYHSQATVMYLDTCNSFSSKHIAQFLNVVAKS